VTERAVLENLYEISQQREINNWSTDILSTFLREPTNNIYENGKLFKVHGLDSLENEVVMTPNGEKHFLLAISGSWCGPCIKGIPKLKSTYDEVSEKVTFISLWNDPNLRTFRFNHIDVKQLISWTSLWDQYGLMANSLEIRAYPTYILFDPNGTEVNRWEGKLPSNLEL
jgi:thiol-disulfide isomerase/thioredoxin